MGRTKRNEKSIETDEGKEALTQRVENVWFLLEYLASLHATEWKYLQHSSEPVMSKLTIPVCIEKVQYFHHQNREQGCISTWTWSVGRIRILIEINECIYPERIIVFFSYETEYFHQTPPRRVWVELRGFRINERMKWMEQTNRQWALEWTKSIISQFSIFPDAMKRCRVGIIWHWCDMTRAPFRLVAAT